MSDTSPHPDALLAKADALIRRHRSFVATPAQSGSASLHTDTTPAAPGHDDFPLLTEIVDPGETARAPRSRVVPEETLTLALTGQQAAARAAIERWVDESLPDAIVHVLDGFTDRLIAAVSERARAELLASLAGELGHTGTGDSPGTSAAAPDTEAP